MINKLLYLVKNNKGVTLIELILYFSLLSIVLLIAVDLMIRSSEFGLEANAKKNLQADANFINQRLASDIHRADDIDTPVNLGDFGSTLVLSIGNETHTYELVGNNLQYTKETPPPVATTQTTNLNSNLTTINSISFERIGNSNGNHTVKIIFEVEDLKGKKGGPIKKTFETVVGIR